MTTEEKDFKQKLFEFYKDAYLQELDAKEKISSRLALNLAVLSVIANICVSFLDAMPPSFSGWLPRTFYSLVAIAIFIGLIALCFFFRAIGFPSGYNYGYIPKTTEIYRFLREAEKYNELSPDGDQIDVESAFRDNLTIQYNGYASRNAEHNHRKNRFVWFTYLFSVWSLIFLLISAPLFYILRYSTAKPPQTVEIVKPIRIDK